MTPPTRTPASKWIEEGLHALARGGPDAVRIEALARTLGVTKGGFYNHFDDRPTLLDEMLGAWERVGVDQVIERVEASGGDGRQKLRRLFEVSSSARALLGIESAIRDWARRWPPITAPAVAGSCTTVPSSGCWTKQPSAWQAVATVLIFSRNAGFWRRPMLLDYVGLP